MSNAVKREFLDAYDVELENLGEWLKELRNGNPRRKEIQDAILSVKEAQKKLRIVQRVLK